MQFWGCCSGVWHTTMPCNTHAIERVPAEVKPLNPTATIPLQPSCWTSGSYTSEIWRKAFQKDYLGKNGTFNSMSLIGIGAFPGCCRIYGIILRKLMEIVGVLDTTYSCLQVLKKTKAAQPWIIKPSSTVHSKCHVLHPGTEKNNSANKNMVLFLNLFWWMFPGRHRVMGTTWNHQKPLSHKFQRCGSIFYLRFSRWCSIKTSVLTARISSGC